MNRLWTPLALVAAGMVVPAALAIGAAESSAKPRAVTQLERLEPSELLLKPPEGLTGGFVVARTAPPVDSEILPGQFPGA